MRFVVTITETYSNTYIVEAANEDQACDIAVSAIEDSKVDLELMDTDIYVDSYGADSWHKFCDVLSLED